MNPKASSVQLCPVDTNNWRAVKALEVFETQQEFVAEPAHYLCLCAYGDDWNPIGVLLEDKVIGFLMWAYDDDERNCWLGGIIIDKAYQRQGYGRVAIQAAIQLLSNTHGYKKFALSYQPQNPAKKLYAELGFVETDEWEDDEIIARFQFSTKD